MQLDKTKIIEILKNEYPKLKEEFGIKRIGLFGSYSQNTANELSDIDLIIEFENPIGLKFINLCDTLETLFNKKVDILTPEGIKNIRVQSLKENILKTIEYIYAA
jgi:predicted nucleotidyltransferase